MLWGLAHVLLDAWYVVFVLLGLRKLFRVLAWLALVIVMLWFAYSVPVSKWWIVP